MAIIQFLSLAVPLQLLQLIQKAPFSILAQLQQILLPDGEKASSVACCFEFIIALSTTGRIFKSRCSTPLNFTEDLELK